MNPSFLEVDAEASRIYAVSEITNEDGVGFVTGYSIEPGEGGLTPSSQLKLPGGSGPRHLALHPDGEHAFLINEMTRDVTAIRVDRESGELTRIAAVSTLPPDAEARGSTAEVVVHPSGEFVYGSNRGHDSIGVFSFDAGTGKLARIENEAIRGRVPRNFALSPDGNWLLAAGQGSGTVAVFRVDPSNGTLDFAGEDLRPGLRPLLSPGRIG